MPKKHLLSPLIVIVTLVLAFAVGFFVLSKYLIVEQCTQVVVFAKDPLSGEKKQFSSPCQIPKGWKQAPFDDMEQKNINSDGIKPIH